MTPPAPGRSAARWRTAGALALAALLLSIWALYNGGPLLYADSIDYLLHGGEAARVLFYGEALQWVSTRSFFYSLAILPLHAYVTTWPIVAAQALATAGVLWLALRTTLARTSAPRFLATVTLLSLASSVGWFVGYVMPDLFASLLVLGIFLSCFAWSDLRGSERAAVAFLVWFAIVAHASHLLLAGALLAVVAALSFAQEGTWRAALRAPARLAALLVAGALSTLLLHRALLGEASLGGRRPLFLLARTLADGPARSYLHAHCGELDLAICAFQDRLPDNVRDVLWAEDGIWETTSEQTRERLRREEMQVVVAAVRSDPWRQLAASSRNFAAQLGTFGMQGTYFPDLYIVTRIREALPGSGDRFFRSRQARRTLHEEFFAGVQQAALAASLLAIAICGVLLGRDRVNRLTPLGILVLCALLFNAAITGVISEIEDRYQARVIWLVPLLACVFTLAWLDARRGSATGAASSDRLPAWPAP